MLDDQPLRRVVQKEVLDPRPRGREDLLDLAPQPHEEAGDRLPVSDDQIGQRHDDHHRRLDPPHRGQHGGDALGQTARLEDPLHDPEGGADLADRHTQPAQRHATSAEDHQPLGPLQGNLTDALDQLGVAVDPLQHTGEGRVELFHKGGHGGDQSGAQLQTRAAQLVHQPVHLIAGRLGCCTHLVAHHETGLARHPKPLLHACLTVVEHRDQIGARLAEQFVSQGRLGCAVLRLAEQLGHLLEDLVRLAQVTLAVPQLDAEVAEGLQIGLVAGGRLRHRLVQLHEGRLELVGLDAGHLGRIGQFLDLLKPDTRRARHILHVAGIVRRRFRHGHQAAGSSRSGIQHLHAALHQRTADLAGIALKGRQAAQRLAHGTVDHLTHLVGSGQDKSEGKCFRS